MKPYSIIYLILTILFISCSSMPKDEKVQNVTATRSLGALHIERGNNEYRWNNYDSALALYSKALTLSSSVDWEEGVIRSMVQISRTLDQLGETEKALIYAETAAAFMEARELDALRVLTLNRKAEWYFYQDKTTEAFKFLEESIKAGKDLETEEIGESWRIKAAILKKKKDYGMALEAIEEAVAIDKKGFFLGELASDYYIRASILSLSGKYSEAIESMELALEKDKFIENSAGIAMDLYGLGKIHNKNGNSEMALDYFKRLYLVYKGANDGTVPEFLIESLKDLSTETDWLPEIDMP